MSIEHALSSVDYVFHAAALKQVPSCEFYPSQAVSTNVLGTQNVINACVKAKVARAVFLSTDKAVYPVNSMGLTKALMEKLVQSTSRLGSSGETLLSCTRYGNVMASRGSVIPLFVDAAISNKPLTITNPDMTRFMMSLDEAVHLVYHSFLNATAGDIFVHKAPACTIRTLAEAIREIFNSSSSFII